MNATCPLEPRCCPVLELRQYTLQPGQRDVLIDLFDRHFIESQEAVGMTVMGQFRDRRRADRFVWMRGFSNMKSRHQALEDFYGGPVWAAHRTDANNTMVDSDDVLLLKPARPELAFHLDPGTGTSSHDGGPSTVLAGIYQIGLPVETNLVSRFEQHVVPILQANHVKVEGVFVTESARNTFTRLPVREGEQVLVWFGVMRGGERSPAWTDRLASLAALDNRQPSLLELEPTSRSILGAGQKAVRATKDDFDFLFGSWNVHNKYLNSRLRHSTEWIEFDARSYVDRCCTGLAISIVIPPCATDYRLRGSHCGCSIRRSSSGPSIGRHHMRAPCCVERPSRDSNGDLTEFSRLLCGGPRNLNKADPQ